MFSSEDAEKAIELLNMTIHFGRSIIVKKQRPRIMPTTIVA
jgi:RNA recognition motif-containing protein